jgi:hypothetical protein
LAQELQGVGGRASRAQSRERTPLRSPPVAMTDYRAAAPDGTGGSNPACSSGESRVRCELDTTVRRSSSDCDFGDAVSRRVGRLAAIQPMIRLSSAAVDPVVHPSPVAKPVPGQPSGDCAGGDGEPSQTTRHRPCNLKAATPWRTHQIPVAASPISVSQRSRQ